MKTGLIFPLEDLVKFEGNVYKITVAASRRAYQLAKINDPIIEEYNGYIRTGIRKNI